MIDHKCLICGQAHAACCGSCQNYAPWIARFASYYDSDLQIQLEDEVRFLRFTMSQTEEQVTSRLHMLAVYLMDKGREADADGVLDLMDRVVGWCAPHMRIDNL